MESIIKHRFARVDWLRLFDFVGLCALLTVIQGCATGPCASAPVAHYGVVDKQVLGGPGGWDFITFDVARQRLFISRGDRVQVWSPESRKVSAEIAGTVGIHGVALAPDLNKGFTSNGRADTVSVFGLDDLKVTHTVAIPGHNPDAILYEPHFKRVYAFNGKSNDVTVIDAESLKVLSTIALGGKPEVAVADGGGHVFVNIEDTSELVVLDQASNKVQNRWPLSPCANPTGLAIDTIRQRLFSVCDNNKMVVVDATSGRHVADLPIGSGPDGAEFDPVLGLAFSANGDGTLTVIREDNAEHFSVVANVPTQPKARTLSLDPLTHRVYLVSASFGPTPGASVDGKKPRPPMLPDSFTVLVVAPK